MQQVYIAITIAWIVPTSFLVAQERTQKGPNPLAPIVDEPGLPRVLLIGDSISIGYTIPTRTILHGRANVHRIPVNGGTTVRGLEQIDEWIGDSEWDVIHFNWGLHDLKRIEGKPQVPIEEYENNLDRLVSRMKRTNAQLIWASTTPVPEGAAQRTPGDEQRYNEAAARVMKKHGVPTNDLHAVALSKLADIQRPQNVHFTSAGSQLLAEAVSQSITKSLADR